MSDETTMTAQEKVIDTLIYHIRNIEMAKDTVKEDIYNPE